MPDTTLPAPWERQPGESARAYAAFCAYRDLPPRERSILRAAELLGYVRAPRGQRRPNVPGRIVAWSQRWRWAERALAWDEEQDRLARAAETEAIKAMRDRHAREAMALQQKALERLRAMDPSELSPSDVLRYFVEAAKLERLARGEPEMITEHRGDWAEAVLQTWQRRRAQHQRPGESNE